MSGKCGAACMVLTVLAAALPAAASEQKKEVLYYAIFAGGQKLGHAVYTREVSGKQVVTGQEMKLTIARMGQPMTMTTVQTSTETLDGEPMAFEFLQGFGIMAQSVKGTIDPSGKLVLATKLGETVTRQTRNWPAGALMNEGVRLLALEKGLTEGTRYSFKMFDPTFMSGLDVEVHIGPRRQVDLLGRVVKLTEVAMTMKGPTGQVGVTTYVDEEYREHKTVIPMLGMELELIACDRAFALSPDSPPDFFRKLLVASPVALDEAAAAKSILYVLAPTGSAALRIPTTDNQTVKVLEGGKVEVTVRPASMPAGAAFPYRGRDETALAALKATQFVQSDSPKIRAAAAKAVGDAADAAEAVRRIEKFVAEYVKDKNLSVGYASALEVLESRQGDCTEHAVLAAALCRSIGIPARVATGVVYAGKILGDKPAFLPHGWVEARVGERWVCVDAAAPARDARRVTLCLGEGEPVDFFGMLSTLGCFKIEQIRVEPTTAASTRAALAR